MTTCLFVQLKEIVKNFVVNNNDQDDDRIIMICIETMFRYKDFWARKIHKIKCAIELFYRLKGFMNKYYLKNLSSQDHF